MVCTIIFWTLYTLGVWEFSHYQESKGIVGGAHKVTVNSVHKMELFPGQDVPEMGVAEGGDTGDGYHILLNIFKIS